MEDFAIFICHTCKVSTKNPSLEYKNINVRSIKLTRALDKFKSQHPGHDVVFYPDGNGQFRASDYDFNTRNFKWKSWW